MLKTQMMKRKAKCAQGLSKTAKVSGKVYHLVMWKFFCAKFCEIKDCVMYSANTYRCSKTIFKIVYGLIPSTRHFTPEISLQFACILFSCCSDDDIFVFLLTPRNRSYYVMQICQAWCAICTELMMVKTVNKAFQSNQNVTQKSSTKKNCVQHQFRKLDADSDSEYHLVASLINRRSHIHTWKKCFM